MLNIQSHINSKRLNYLGTNHSDNMSNVWCDGQGFASEPKMII